MMLDIVNCSELWEFQEISKACVRLVIFQDMLILEVNHIEFGQNVYMVGISKIMLEFLEQASLAWSSGRLQVGEWIILE